MLSSCAIGPNFHAPKAPTTTKYSPSELPQSLTENNDGALKQQFINATVDSAWWKAFNSGPLNNLVNSALQHNFDLKAAEENLKAAKEIYKSQWSLLLPQIDLNYSAQKSRNADSLANPLSNPPDGSNPANPYTLHTAQVNVSYGIDLWGSNRRMLEQSKAQTEGIYFQTQAARQALISNVLVTAMQITSLSEQLHAAHESTEASLKMLNFMQRQKDLGAVGVVDVAPYEANLVQDTAAEQTLLHTLRVSKTLLETLLGKDPSQIDETPNSLSEITLPKNLPYILPSELISKRADIAYARSQLHAAYANVGVADAAFLPSINLNGNDGGAAQKLAEVLSSGNLFRNLAVDVTAPLTNIYGLYHSRKAAQAQLNAAQAQYESTVIAGLRDVANTLDALFVDSQITQSAQRGEISAERLLKFTQTQLDVGDTGEIQLLSIIRMKYQADITLHAAELQNYTDTVAFYMALGGEPMKTE